ILNVNGATVVGVSDVLGRRAQLPTVRAKSPGISTMDLSGLPTGVYLVELEQDGARRVERVVKR
ncbi:MAG TPA: T9SS type A sorting domain-containing protein, partial [Flavobacteriales bacterium]|nr:T9SS type A sorting domain-containing protein [Flavobacteriales bacterium]